MSTNIFNFFYNFTECTFRFTWNYGCRNNDAGGDDQ